MAKIIRPTYPANFSIGLLLLIFFLATFLSFEIFDVKWNELMEGQGPILGMVLAGVAVVIVALILWEEFLFPVRLKPIEDEIIFRNHFTKLKSQVLIYSFVPAIVIFLYLNYKISSIAFFIWAAICVIAPVVGKLSSGIRNYNDFLKLTNDTIEFRNNEKEGVLKVKDIKEILLIKDESNVLHKISVVMSNDTTIAIDLDEMELEAYLDTIEQFVASHYGVLVNHA